MLEGGEFSSRNGTLLWQNIPMAYSFGFGKTKYNIKNLQFLPKEYNSHLFPRGKQTLTLSDGSLDIPCWIADSFPDVPQVTVEEMKKYVSLVEKCAIDKTSLSEEEEKFVSEFNVVRSDVFIFRPRGLNFGRLPRRRDLPQEEKKQLREWVDRALSEM